MAHPHQTLALSSTLSCLAPRAARPARTDFARRLVRSIALVAAGLAAAPLTVSAADDCTTIGDDRERLVCYDRVAGKPRANILPATPSVPIPAPLSPAAAAGPASPDGSSAAAGASATARRPPSSLFTTGQPLDVDGKLPVEAGPVERSVRDVRRSLGSSLADRWELDRDQDRGRFLLRPYKPMYVMLGDWTSRVNNTPSSPNPNNNVTTPRGFESTDMKFQLSFKSKVAQDLIANNGDLWIGYTQASYWQIYNGKASRPFRETNYEPEAMLVFHTNYSVFGWNGRLAGLSLNHQSNGRGDPESRSWNRVIAQLGFERDNWMVMLRPWWRIPENRADDNNPDIQNYVGRADLLIVRKSEGHEFSVLARHSLRGGENSHGSLQLDYAFPISSYLKGYAQLFTGYGASLIDYTHRQTRFGLGVSLVQWL